MPRPKPITIILEVPYRTAKYFEVTAINRFFDNIERALKGDKECLSSLLAEDLPEAREYYETTFRAVQSACNEEIARSNS